MRAQEFILEYREAKSKRAHRSGVDLEAWQDGPRFQINATSHGRELGRVVFDVQYQGNDTILVAQDLMIHPEYRGQGIAAVMYDYAKELGYVVERSPEQTAAGKQFWDKNRGEEATVWENFADGKVKGKSRPGRVKRAGASCNGSVTDLRARAKRASGEKARMYHWCANMKSGKKNESEMDEGWKQNVAAGVLGAGMTLGGGTAQADTDVFNKKLTPAEIQQIQTKADLTQRYYNELVRRAKEDGRIMDRATLNMLKAKAQDAAARSVQQQPQAPQAKSTLPGTQPSEIRRSANYKNFESVKK